MVVDGEFGAQALARVEPAGSNGGDLSSKNNSSRDKASKCKSRSKSKSKGESKRRRSKRKAPGSPESVMDRSKRTSGAAEPPAQGRSTKGKKGGASKKAKSKRSSKASAAEKAQSGAGERAKTPEPESEQKRRSTIAEEEAKATVESEVSPEAKGGEGRSRSRSGGSSVLASLSKSRRRKARAQEEAAATPVQSAEPPGQPEASPCRHSLGVIGLDGGGGGQEQGGQVAAAKAALEDSEPLGAAAHKGRKKHGKSNSRKGSHSGSHARKGSSSRRHGRKQTASLEAGPIDFCGDFSVPLEQANSEFVCLSEGEIVAEQAVQIANISEVLSVPTATSVALLKHFKWNKDRLLTAYFDSPEQVLWDAGAVQDESSCPSVPPEDPLLVDECTICGEELSSTNSFGLGECGHNFCTDCWEQYLTIKINEGQTTQLACPHQLCGTLLPEDAIHALVPEDVFKKYCQFFMQSFVNDSEHVKWCPAPNCGRAVTATMVHRQTVLCSCGHRFCFRCSEEAHLPATCEQVKEWRKKCQDESETKHWIMANTRDCPKCQLPTEKNGGCNHMTCQQCKHEYCWICMKDWKGHNDYYTCNRLVKSSSKEEKVKAGKKAGKRERERQREEMRRALEKYLHFSSRYLNHEKCKEFDRLQQLALGKMHELQETEATGAELLYIEHATEQLCKCRHLLKYSYVHRYYMQDGDSEEELFAFLQESLEITVEQLAAALQRPKNRRVEIIDLTCVAARRLSNILAAVDVL